MTEGTTRRGRPRPQDTIERDKQVYAKLLEGPATREQLAESLGAPPTHVYLSLYRLRRDGRAQRLEDQRFVWQAVE